MPWQQHVADVALEVDPASGRFAYREVLLTVPRRSGKSLLLLAALLHRMIAMDRPQVAAFTMQNGLQARMRLRREWHNELLKRSALARAYEPSFQTGAEALLFHNGSRLEVSAGTASSGHGLTLDLAVVDEAFDQPDDRLEQAFRPAIRTQPDAQLWWVSTAGSPADQWFRSKVERGRETCGAESGTAVFEWSAADDADPADPQVWRECMPALGYVRPDGSGLRERDIAEEFRSMELDGFRRAYLNQWVDRGAEGAFELGSWEALISTLTPPTAPSFAVATAPDRSWSAIGAACARPDGMVQVFIPNDARGQLDYRPGTAWVPPRVAELRERWGPSVLTDPAADGLVPDATRLTGQAQAQAHNALADAVEAGTVRHGNEPALNTAVRAARWRALGDTRVLDRKGSADISPLIAVALAAYGLTTAPSTGGWMVGMS
jgi:hypothetical protein